MRRVLVTGGAGFIGSHVVDKLAAAGFEPRIYDLRHSPYHDPDSVDTVIGDILDAEALRRAMMDCEAVIHLAACADVGIVAEQPTDAEETNARGTLAVLEAARATDTRVLYGSTVWVYGASGDGPLDEAAPLGLPDHLYTASKLAGEMYCASYAQLYGVRYTILRFGIPYGPRARPTAVIPIFVAKALQGDPLTIAGDGMQTRRFVYVEDLAEGVVAAIENGADGRVYNLAGDETVSIRELAEIVSELIDDARVVHTPGRTGDFGGAVISNERAAGELGWRASTSLREGVRRYLGWLEPKPTFVGYEEASLGSAHHATADGMRDVMETRLRPRRWTPSPVPLPAGAWVVALACAVGTLFPSLLALRTDDFGTGQAEYVAISCLIAILAVFCLLPLGPGGRPPRGRVIGSWLIALYVGLQAFPWSRHRLELGLPHRGTIVLCLMGLALAVGLAGVAMRLRVRQPARDPTG